MNLNEAKQILSENGYETNIYILMVKNPNEDKYLMDSAWSSKIKAEEYAEDNLDPSSFDWKVESLPFEP